MSISVPVTVDPGTRRRSDLRDFLMTRRAQISPDEVGLAGGGGRRRTPGLRREEVAVLAGVGSSWYQWLEQGRDITVSAQVLDSIARVLRLDEPELRHLYALAGLNPPPPDCGPAKPVDDALIRIVEAWMPKPGHLIDRYWNSVVSNRAADLTLGVGEPDANCLKLFFLNDLYRHRRADWEAVAPRVVATYRSEMTARPNDPGYQWIVDELVQQSPEFAELWSRQDVQDTGVNIKAVTHPAVGDMFFESTLLSVADRPDLRIALHNPREGTETLAKLERLLAADEKRGGLYLVPRAG